MFNQGFWNKDPGLWEEIKKADWKDVILKEDFKKKLQDDVYGFFKAEEVYKKLSIPWKVRHSQVFPSFSSLLNTPFSVG